MACFLVPTTEAIVTTVAKKVVEKKEKKAEAEGKSYEGKVKFSQKLSWLNNLLWGGAILLAFEHLWHGEVVPFFPFLTAASNPDDAAEMLHEMATTGVTMAVLVTIVWVCMCVATHFIETRNTASVEAK